MRRGPERGRRDGAGRLRQRRRRLRGSAPRCWPCRRCSPAAPARGVAAPAGAGRDRITASDETDARKRARIRLELAVGYFEQGQTTIALDEVKQAILADPTSSEAYNLRGLIYMRLDDDAPGRGQLPPRAALNPRDADALHNYGWLLCQQKRYAEAEPLFERALAEPTYGDRAKTLMAQGVCQVRAGQLRRGRAHPGAVLRARRRQPGDRRQPGATCCYQRGDFERAHFYIRRVNNSDVGQRRDAVAGCGIERKRRQPRRAADSSASQLRGRFPQSREAAAFDRGQFDE